MLLLNFDLETRRSRLKFHTQQRDCGKTPHSSAFSIFQPAESGRSSTRSNTGAVKSLMLLLIFDHETCRIRQKLHTQQRFCGKKPTFLLIFDLQTCRIRQKLHTQPRVRRAKHRGNALNLLKPGLKPAQNTRKRRTKRDFYNMAHFLNLPKPALKPDLFAKSATPKPSFCITYRSLFKILKKERGAPLEDYVLEF